MPGEMQVTISLRKVICGTELAIVQEGLPTAIPVEFCYAGVAESLAQLADVVNRRFPMVRNRLQAVRHPGVRASEAMRVAPHTPA